MINRDFQNMVNNQKVKLSNQKVNKETMFSRALITVIPLLQTGLSLINGARINVPELISSLVQGQMRISQLSQKGSQTNTEKKDKVNQELQTTEIGAI